MGALWNPETNSPSRDPGSCTLSSEQSSPPSTHGSPGTQLSACRPCLDTLCPPRVSLTTGPLGDLGASAHQQTPSGSLPPLKSPPSRECGCGGPAFPWRPTVWAGSQGQGQPRRPSPRPCSSPSCLGLLDLLSSHRGSCQGRSGSPAPPATSSQLPASEKSPWAEQGRKNREKAGAGCSVALPGHCLSPAPHLLSSVKWA